MQRRELLGTLAAAGVAAALPARGQERAASPATVARERPKVVRKGRIKQGLWKVNFGPDTTLTFDDMCREAARLGCYGFDMIGEDEWPTLRKHGLDPLIVGTGGVDFPHGLIYPERHKEIEATLRPYIDKCAQEKIRTIISIGGQRKGMPLEQGQDAAVAFLNRIKGQLEDKGVVLAIENMNNRRTDPNFGREDQIFGHWDWGVGVCERVNSPNVKLVCDVYHLQIMDGDLETHLRNSIQWIAHFHVAGVPARHEIDYTQEVNFRYIAQVIAELPYHGYLTHEWRPTPGRDPLESIEQALEIMDV